MKVLLFVQSGDARPKCVRERVLRYANGDIMWGPRWSDAKHRADRWWLVRCKNADEGRRLIGREGRMPQPFHEDIEGRIIASGGKPRS